MAKSLQQALRANFRRRKRLIWRLELVSLKWTLMKVTDRAAQLNGQTTSVELIRKLKKVVTAKVTKRSLDYLRCHPLAHSKTYSAS